MIIIIGSNMFSKFDYKAGKYDNMTMPSTQNSTLRKYYALKLALEAKKTHSKDLQQQLQMEISKKLKLDEF